MIMVFINIYSKKYVVNKNFLNSIVEKIQPKCLTDENPKIFLIKGWFNPPNEPVVKDKIEIIAISFWLKIR